MEWDVLIPLAGMAATVVLCFPLVAAGARYRERKNEGGTGNNEISDLREDLSLIQDRLEQLHLNGDRLGELEERVDFTERLIARDRKARRVEGKH